MALLAEKGACCACNLKQQKPGTATASPATTGKCSAAHEIKYGKRPSCPGLACSKPLLRFWGCTYGRFGSTPKPPWQWHCYRAWSTVHEPFPWTSILVKGLGGTRPHWGRVWGKRNCCEKLRDDSVQLVPRAGTPRKGKCILCAETEENGNYTPSISPEASAMTILPRQ